MKDNRTQIIMIFILSVVFLLACEIKTAGIDLGSMLLTDKNGFLTEKEIYNLEDRIYTFDTDGSYEYFRYSADGTQSSGTKGSYSWNTSTMLLSLEYSSRYDSISDSWESYESFSSYSAYFTTSSFGKALLVNENEVNKYSFYQKNNMGEGVTGEITCHFYIGIDSLTFEGELIIISDADLAERPFMAFELAADVIGSFPADIVWEEGATKSFNLRYTTFRQKAGNPETLEWGEWENITESNFGLSELSTFTHCGSFIVPYNQIPVIGDGSSWHAQKSLLID